MSDSSTSVDKERDMKDASIEDRIDELTETRANPIERKRILRKLDTHLLPWVATLYLMSFLDRSNIGNAKVAGLSKDLKLVGLQYNIAAAIFFVSYAVFEVPSNIILKLIPPSKWIPSIMTAWGIVITLMCLVKSYQGLVIARFFLGLTESGLFPGVTYYLSLWYPRREQGARFAIFFAAPTAAGAFGGILAFGISKMEGIGGLHGWQWIFCLEGLATLVVAVFAFIYMQDLPEVATFLTESERKFVMRMRREDQPETTREFKAKYIIQALKDYKTYLFMTLYVCLIIPIYSVSLFTPPIINALGYSAANAQLMSIPIFVIGCIFTIISGPISDRLNSRGPMVIGWAVVSLIGYIVSFTQTRPGVAYFGGILTTGAFVTIPPSLAWITGNTAGDLKRSVVIAMVIGTGNLGGICSSFIYMKPPRYLVGHGVNIGCLCLSVAITLILMWDFNRLNKKRIERCRREGIDESRAEEFKHMGDASPLFRYTI